MNPSSGSEAAAVTQGVQPPPHLTNPTGFDLQDTKQSLAQTSMLGTAGNGEGGKKKGKKR